MLPEVIEPTSQPPLRRLTPERKKHSSPKEVSVYDFTDYREFLTAYLTRRQEDMPTFSRSLFVRKAGMGQNSRGYLKLVIEGKRNLTPHTLRGFSQALGLKPQESMYFENLVYFNQARNSEEKEYYFQRMIAADRSKDSRLFQLALSQYNYYKHWYYPAVRELVDLAGFREDLGWLAAQLRNKISRKEIKTALIELEQLGLIKRNAEGKLIQSQPLVKFKGGTFNFVAENFQMKMMDRAKEALRDDPYPERNASGATISCDRERFPAILKCIEAFRDDLCMKFGVGNIKPDAVIHINFQTFQLTPIPKKPLKNESQEECP